MIQLLVIMLGILFELQSRHSIILVWLFTLICKWIQSKSPENTLQDYVLLALTLLKIIWIIPVHSHGYSQEKKKVGMPESTYGYLILPFLFYFFWQCRFIHIHALSLNAMSKKLKYQRNSLHQNLSCGRFNTIYTSEIVLLTQERTS